MASPFTSTPQSHFVRQLPVRGAFWCALQTHMITRLWRISHGGSRGGHCVKSHIVYRLCNHMVYSLSLIQSGVIVQEIALFECVNSLVQVDAADSELPEH